MWTNKYWLPRLLILNTVLLKFFMPVKGRVLMTNRILNICTARLYFDRVCFCSLTVGWTDIYKASFCPSVVELIIPIHSCRYLYFGTTTAWRVLLCILSQDPLGRVLLSYCLRVVTACDSEFLCYICNQAVTPTWCSWPLCCRYQQMHRELQIGNVWHRTQSHTGCQGLHMQRVQDEA